MMLSPRLSEREMCLRARCIFGITGLTMKISKVPVRI
jgi:hypothetical protein